MGIGLVLAVFEVWLFSSLPLVAGVQLLVCAIFVLLAFRRTRRRIQRLRSDRGTPGVERFLAGFDLAKHDVVVVRMVYDVLMARSRSGGLLQILPDDDLEIIHEDDLSEMPLVLSLIRTRLGAGEESDKSGRSSLNIRTPREIVAALERRR